MLIPVLIGVSLLIFIAIDLAPGNEIDVLYADEADPVVLARLEHEYGYDRSVFYRYGKYMLGFLKGDFGESTHMMAPVFDVYFQRLPNTAFLAVCSIIVAHLISIPLGIVAARHAGSLTDNGSMVLALLGLSIPNFWLGLMLILAFSLYIKIFPSGGIDGFKSVILPAITIGTGLTATITRTTRSSMVDVLSQDYLRTARSKGVPEKKVINKHALKNALIPIITVSGSQFAGTLGGAVLTETVFSWPGVGRLTIEAINFRDVKLATGSLMMTTIFTCLIMLAVDILYAFIDPRIKAKYQSHSKRRAVK